MRLLIPQSEIVTGILDNLQKISLFVTKEIKTWRKLTVKNIIAFSQPLADDFYYKFSNSSEAKVIKDKYYPAWGCVGIKVEGRPTWYYPYSLIQLVTFNVEIKDLLVELSFADEFIDVPFFIDTVTRMASSMVVKFKQREIDVLKFLVMSTQEEQIPELTITFAEIARGLGMSMTQARNYWTNLDKFFSTGIHIDYGKVGLRPVLVKHGRELTELEKKYTKYSFHDRSLYYSLLFIPTDSSWVEINEMQDTSFESLGDIRRMDYEWNLTHLPEEIEGRWGSYPRMNRKQLKRKPACSIHYGYSQAIKGLHVRDFEILDSLFRSVGRTKETAAEIGVTSAYLSQRTGFLMEKRVIIPRVDLHYCGLDVEVFLIIHCNEENETTKRIIDRVTNNLIYFPNVEIYSGEECLLAKIKISSRWMNQYLLETQNLSEPGGYWYDNGIKAITRHSRTKSSIKNPLSNLHELVIPRKIGTPAKLGIDWSFEISDTEA